MKQKEGEMKIKIITQNDLWCERVIVIVIIFYDQYLWFLMIHFDFFKGDIIIVDIIVIMV